MASVEKRDKQLRRLAAVLAAQPEISYQALAERAEISRRTLYRIAPSREALLGLLCDAAMLAMQGAIERAKLASADPTAVFRSLTEDFVADDDLYAYWVATARTISPPEDIALKMAASMSLYRSSMEGFVRRAQADGFLRPDLSAEWVIRAYDGLLAAASDAKSDFVRSEDIVEQILSLFLDGVGRKRRGSK